MDTDVLLSTNLDNKINCIKNEFKETIFDIINFVYYSKKIKLMHVVGDYLPSRIQAEGTFYESDFLKFFSLFNVDDGIVVDIGGNIGNHSVYFGAIKGWDVITFEPVRQNALCLSVNTSLNGIAEKTIILETALGKCEGHIYLSKLIGDNNGSFSHCASQSDGAVKVHVKELDAIPEIKNVTRPLGLIKIDVEGMEYDVLQGAVHTLIKHQPALALECTTQGDYNNIVNLISPLGYFPIEVMNATATFIFLNKNNSNHIEKLSEYLTMYTGQRKEKIYNIF